MDAAGRWIRGVCLVLLAFDVASRADSVVDRMLERCREYSKSVYEIIPDPILLPGAEPKKRDTCTISTQTTIVGGVNALPQEFPHMALIGYGDNPTQWQCGGSLISEQWVLSAAHCIATKKTHLLARYARLGDLDVYSTSDDASPITIKIIRRVKHKDYKSPQSYNDIALFQLEEPVEFDSYIRPICLHGLLSPRNKTVFATGWGNTFYGGGPSSHLLKVGLDVVDNGKCNKDWQEKAVGNETDTFRKILTQGVKEANQVCAWGPRKDSCQGDSGGPIQQALIEPYCMYTIIGIVSVGLKCGGEIPGVYTRVSNYLPWIESVVWPQQ